MSFFSVRCSRCTSWRKSASTPRASASSSGWMASTLGIGMVGSTWLSSSSYTMLRTFVALRGASAPLCACTSAVPS